MPTAYESLVERLRRIHALSETAALLQWDQETHMPPGGLEARAVELSTIARLSHELFTAPEVGRLLAAAESKERGPRHAALLRETRFAYDRATKVPDALVEKISNATSRALPAWEAAKGSSDFARFLPVLGEVLDLMRQYADAIDPGRAPYEVLFQDHEPWIPFKEARGALLGLDQALSSIIPAATTRTASWASPFAGAKWPAQGQLRLCGHVLDMLGYDRQRGRLDVSAHPFSTGNVFDSRITTRFHEDDPLSSVFSVIHEFGHALYTLGLPPADFGTPLGDAQGLVVHESQSRLWENHVGRSRAFFDVLTPRIHEAFGAAAAKVTPEAAWRAANQVRPSFIRVEADELTYHGHILVRLQVEEALVSGHASVKEAPSLWEEAMEARLGLSPPDDARGCLQDIHWAHGAFGYFPTYTLGSLLSAQVFAAYSKTHDAAREIQEGRFAPLRDWLKSRVHGHGKALTTPELIEAATGGPLSHDAFVAYAKTKFVS